TGERPIKLAQLPLAQAMHAKTAFIPPRWWPLCVALFAMSGCVIPVAPQFDDPEQNYPPYIVSSDPGEGSIFTPGATPDDRDIAVTLADQNLNDHLFVRWIFDYP